MAVSGPGFIREGGPQVRPQFAALFTHPAIAGLDENRGFRLVDCPPSLLGAQCPSGSVLSLEFSTRVAQAIRIYKIADSSITTGSRALDKPPASLRNAEIFAAPADNGLWPTDAVRLPREVAIDPFSHRKL